MYLFCKSRTLGISQLSELRKAPGILNDAAYLPVLLALRIPRDSFDLFIVTICSPKIYSLKSVNWYTCALENGSSTIKISMN